MTPTQQTILHCLQANVTNATSCGLGEFAKEQLRKYERHLEKQKINGPKWDKFIEKEKL